MKRMAMACALMLLASAAANAADITIGEKLPEVNIQEKGMLVPETDVVDGKLVFKEGGDIDYRPWSSSELTGKIRTVYHLAARIGIDNINAHYIDAIIAADLDEHGPDALYQTVTVLNTDEALWGTTGLAHSRMESSQKEFPYAGYVIDAEGEALAAWGLESKSSAVIIVDEEGTVLWYKDGKLTDTEVEEAVGIVEKELAELRGGGDESEAPQISDEASPSESETE